MLPVWVSLIRINLVAGQLFQKVMEAIRLLRLVMAWELSWFNCQQLVNSSPALQSGATRALVRESNAEMEAHLMLPVSQDLMFGCSWEALESHMSPAQHGQRPNSQHALHDHKAEKDIHA